MTKLLNDLITLTTLPEKKLTKLFKTAAYVIVQAIKEDNEQGIAITDIDVNLGVFSIKHVKGEDLKFKFVPKEDFTKVIQDTCDGKLNSMNKLLVKSFKKNFLDVYKDLC